MFDRRHVVATGLVAGFALCSAVPAVAQEVGTAAAVNPSAQARGTGGSRTIVIGQSIAHRERIQTASSGTVQLLFLDKTSMTVGPNSDLSIDEYIYDPAANTGRLAASLSKGVMRFVGGQISHAGNAQVSTPTAVVGVRGGVGIFSPNSVYIGYGEGVVTSGQSSVTLSAGEYVQTFGGATPPSTPGAPPPGYLESVIALLQSKPGQGGGAPKTVAQVERARRPIAGRLRRPEEDLPIYPYWPFIWPTLAAVKQTIETEWPKTILELAQATEAIGTVSQSPPAGVAPTQQTAQTLFGFTGGLIRPVGANGAVGQAYAAFGTTSLALVPANNRSQANFSITSVGQTSPNNLLTGNFQYGSTDPNLPSGNITINQLIGLTATADGLAPAVNGSGAPISTINNGPLISHEGSFVEIKPGSQLSNALSSSVKTQFCQCDYTRWGLWDSQSLRPGPNNATIEERATMFWVAGKQPSIGEVPTGGVATYSGHAIANIRNGSQSYIAAGGFSNTVNFGTRTGTVSISQLDGTNYGGRMIMNGSDPRLFFGALTSLGGQSRNMGISGSFFNGASGPVGEMGGALQITGPSYLGAGIFIGKK